MGKGGKQQEADGIKHSSVQTGKECMHIKP